MYMKVTMQEIIKGDKLFYRVKIWGVPLKDYHSKETAELAVKNWKIIYPEEDFLNQDKDLETETTY